MASRRPNMPRVRAAEQGHDANAADERENDAVPAPSAPSTPRKPAEVNRQKVVPMGAAPGHEHASAGASSRPSAAGKPAAKKAAASKPAASTRAASKPAAKKPAAGNSTTQKQPGKPAASSSGKAPAKPSATSSSAHAKTGAAARKASSNVSATKPSGGSAAAKPSAGKPKQAGKRPGPRQGGPREKRLRERAELSGAIRSGSGHREPEATQTPAEGGSPVPARAFSGRLLTLAVILAVVTVLLLPSVGTYMDQRAEVAEVQASIAEKQQEQDELTSQIARWDDPAYVKAQSRNRINLVMPGEKKYMVVGATGDDSAAGPQSVGNVRTDLPWVDSLWDTVVRSATD